MSEFINELANKMNVNSKEVIEMFTNKFDEKSMFFSIDIETDGINHNLLAIGIVVFDHLGNEVDSLNRALIPVGESDEETVDWLKKQKIVLPNGSVRH